MDVSSFFFIAILILLGGVIALIGDRLGRKLGKERRRLWGLRPRRTAEVITVAAGILIPMVTVGLILLVSADLRRLFTEGRAAIEQAESLRKTRDELRQEVERRQGELGNLQSELSRQRSAVAVQTNAASKARAEASRLGERSQALLARVGSLQSRFASLNASFQKLQTENAKAEVQLLEAQKRTNRMLSDFDFVSRDLRDAREYERRLDAENRQLERERTRLLDESRKLQSEIASVQGELTQLKELVATTRSDADREIRERERELERAEVQLAVRQRQLEDLEREIEVLKGIFGNSRTQPMIFRFGEEIARVQAPPSANEAEARTHLTRLIRASRVEAEARGARGTRNVPSAGVFERIAEGRPVSPEEQIRRMATALTQIQGPVVLVSTSSLNAFLGEPVSLDVAWYPNPVVFRPGEVVAETRIDGDLAPELIFARLQEFVNGAVRERAVKAGLVLRRSPEASIVTMSSLTLSELAREIHEMRRLVRIQAVALQETRGGDELRIEFRLR